MDLRYARFARRNGTTSAAPAIPSFALTGLFESKKFLFYRFPLIRPRAAVPFDVERAVVVPVLPEW